MPTYAEWAWLRNNCEWVWTDDYNGSGKAGMVVTSKVGGFEDSSIFLPAAGGCEGTTFKVVGDAGDYWSSSLDVTFSTSAKDVFFSKSGRSDSSSYRFYGMYIRPVSD